MERKKEKSTKLDSTNVGTNIFFDTVSKISIMKFTGQRPVLAKLCNLVK